MRNREEVIRDFVQEWLEKAEADLEAAEILAAHAMHDYFTCAFHCQQACEKFLKAYLVRHQIEFRKTHDLGKLLELASQAESVLGEDLASSNWLTPFGVEFRYPGEYEEVDQAKAQSALTEAKQVKQVVMEHLGSYLEAEDHGCAG
ncbi:MAG: HEPN domain-containing protein [Anaerolineae bacterium]|nr:HEPN domain-containing protein [Anaerolineae bacterium]